MQRLQPLDGLPCLVKYVKTYSSIIRALTRSNGDIATHFNILTNDRFGMYCELVLSAHSCQLRKGASCILTMAALDLGGYRNVLQVVNTVDQDMKLNKHRTTRRNVSTLSFSLAILWHVVKGLPSYQ